MWQRRGRPALQLSPVPSGLIFRACRTSFLRGDRKSARATRVAQASACGSWLYCGAISSQRNLGREPRDDIARVPVGRKNRVEDMLDLRVTDHKCQSLQQRHPARLEGRQAQGSRKSEVFVRENRKWEMHAVRRLALIGRVLG